MKKVLITGIALKKLTKIKWSYLAGIFDGEGSVFLRRAYNKYGKQRSYSLTITVVCGTHLCSIKKIGNMVGKKNIETINGYGNKKYAGRIRLHNREALLFLYGVQPFCLIKKEQVKLGIKFQENKTKIGGRLTEKRAKSEELAKQKLTILNKRGKNHENK